MAGESAAGPSRTPSRVSHRDSPLGSRRATPAPPLPTQFSPISALAASVRYLSSRLAAGATPPPPPPPPSLPQPRRQPPPPPPPTQPPRLLAGVEDYPATFDPDISGTVLRPKNG